MGRLLSILILAGLLLAPAGVTVAQTNAVEIEFWQSIKESTDASEVEAYLQAYPKGKFAPLARIRLKKLQGTLPPAETAKNKTKRQARPPTAETRRALDFFSDVLDRVRSDFVFEPDLASLIEAAVNGILKDFPSQAGNAVLRTSLWEKCRQSGKESLNYCLDIYGSAFGAAREAFQGKDMKIAETSVSAMMASLNSYSRYIDSKTFADLQVEVRNEIGSIGIEMTMVDGVVKVVSPIDDTPSARAGLRSGDLITHIDNGPVLGLTLYQALAKIRGFVNTPIVLTIDRPGTKNPFDVKLVRQVIRINPVKARLEKGIGYIRITTFNEQTSRKLSQAINELKTRTGPAPKGYILDLRNNTGGMLDQSVAVADLFLDRGVTVTTRPRNTSETERFFAKQGDITNGKPILTLINSGTAGASEVVAAALQDHRRSKIIGTRSYGMGSVQTIIPLGSNGALRLTTARFYTPAGLLIQSKGIEPDFVVAQNIRQNPDPGTGKRKELIPDDITRDKQLQFALSILEKGGVNRSGSPVGKKGNARLGDLCAQVKNFKQAIPACTKLIATKGLDETERYIAHGDRCGAYNESGDYTKALEDCKKAIRFYESDPEWIMFWADDVYPGALINRGNIYLARKRTKLAIADYTKAIRLDSKIAMAYSNRGKAYGSVRDFSRSMRDYQQAVKLDPATSNFRIGLVVGLMQTKKYARALPHIRLLMQTASTNPQVQQFAVRAGAYTNDRALLKDGLALVKKYDPKNYENAKKFIERVKKEAGKHQ